MRGQINGQMYIRFVDIKSVFVSIAIPEIRSRDYKETCVLASVLPHSSCVSLGRPLTSLSLHCATVKRGELKLIFEAMPLDLKL